MATMLGIHPCRAATRIGLDDVVGACGQRQSSRPEFETRAAANTAAMLRTHLHRLTITGLLIRRVFDPKREARMNGLGALNYLGLLPSTGSRQALCRPVRECTRRPTTPGAESQGESIVCADAGRRYQFRTQARFGLGVVGGVSQAALGLVGSAGKLGVLAAEREASPTTRAAIDARVAHAVTHGATTAVGYVADAVHDPSCVSGDAAYVADVVNGWVKGEAASAQRAIKDGRGPESLGLATGTVASYLIPVGGEARLAAEGGELAMRGAVTTLTDGTERGVGGNGARTVTDAAAKPLAPLHPA